MKRKEKKISIEERIEMLWEELHKLGIYTEEQLDKSIQDNQLDIGIFTMPYKDNDKK